MTICIKNGKINNDNGPAITFANGDKHWYINGELHNDDGPAIVTSNGDWYWYKNGKLHNDNGPAIILPIGDWYKNGVKNPADINGPHIFRGNCKVYYYKNGIAVEPF